MREMPRPRHVPSVFLGALLSELDATSALPQAFQELRVKFDRIKSHYDSGELSAERYGDLLSSLRCFDAQGGVWTIGATSGLWYKMLNDDWIQWPPPYQDAASAASAARIYSRAAGAAAEVDPDAAAFGHTPVPHTPVPHTPAAYDPYTVPPMPPASQSSGDGLLFGVPEQLFPEQPLPQGPVPYGTFPDAGFGGDDGDVEPPAGRSGGFGPYGA